MLNGTLTIDLSQRAADTIISLAQAIAGTQNTVVYNAPALEVTADASLEDLKEKMIETMKDAGHKAKHHVDDQPEPDTQSEPEAEKPKSTKAIKPEELREVAVTKDRAKVKALLEKWEYKSISAVSEDDRAAFLEELRGL